ncbi:uncharacterized protein LTR77_004211 [Saxophila tyrrhenica]|uniref:Pentatricopeptide repeat protein n=1 Tax=Saxophila tyrrhenica TaxID=1690608 RepID=A0AAV9PF24_9PEZI|nr:hypothetical protein LTR77_004211 [Saxophila tyrrhenica]
MPENLQIDPVWTREYAGIRMLYYAEPEAQRSRIRAPTLDTRAFAWVEEVAQRIEQGQTECTAHHLVQLTGQSPRYAWTQLALWFLAYNPAEMVKFLLATHVEPYVSPVHVQDSLRQLGAYLFHYQGGDDETQLQAVVDAFCVLANRGGDGHLTFNNPFPQSFLARCSVELNLRIYETIKTRGVKIAGWNWLHYTTYFAKNDCYEHALDALVKAHEEGGFRLNSFAFRSNCSTLLRRAISQPDGLRETLRIVSTIVDMGVTLDRPICDIIMLNAIEAGDLKTAFDVYHSLMQRGLRPTESTFTILLKGCKSNIDDVTMLNEVIRDAITNIDVRASKVVASNIMHCLALHHSKHHPETAFQTLTEAYVQFFDLTPLKRLGLPLPTIPPVRLTTADLLHPTPHVLGCMLGASINNILHHNPNDPKLILPLYTRYRTLLAHADPVWAPTASTDHIPNIFLAAFIRRPSGLLAAAQVVKDMQHDHPAASSGFAQCRPTTQTWNIFLHGFSRHGQTRLAERVLQYMRKLGVKEDIVTWNTLIHGYAKVQDEEGVVESVRRGAEGGVVWDRWTEGGVGKLRDGAGRQRVGAMLREREGRVDFGEEIREGLKGRLERVGGGEEVPDGRGCGDGGDGANIYGRPPHFTSSPFMSATPNAQSSHPHNGQDENATAQPKQTPTNTNANIFTFSSPTPAAPSTVPFSRRAVKKAPTPKPDELRERRRGAFLRKIRDEREDERFEARSEDIMRLEFVRRQRAWEEELARQAPMLDAEPTDGDSEGSLWRWDAPGSSAEGMGMGMGMSSQPWAEEEVEEVLGWEEREMEALIEYAPLPTSGEEGRGGGGDAWSDDGDYDALFEEIMGQDGGMGEVRQQNNTVEGGNQATGGAGEAMDMS